MLVDVMTRADAIHLAPNLAEVVVNAALKVKELVSSTTIDLDQLDKHGFIEHDVSLSREDTALGSNSDFSSERWQEMLDVLASGRDGLVGQEEAMKARFSRLLQSKERHKAAGTQIDYTIKTAFSGFAECALLLILLGDGAHCSLAHLRIIFGESVLDQQSLQVYSYVLEQQRMPFAEGWRPPRKVIDKADMRRTILGMIKVHPHRMAELLLILRGTVRAWAASIAGRFCKCLGRRRH